MRVLHVTSTFPRADGDATGPYLSLLGRALAAAGVEVRVVAPHAPGLALDGTVDGVAVRRFRYGPSRTEVLAYRGGLLAAARSPAGAAMVMPYLGAMAAVTRREVRAWRPDLVHAHWWFPGAAAALVRGGVPLVVTLHGSDVELAARRLARPAARFVLRRAAAVVAVSTALAAAAEEVCGVPVRVAEMPVDVDVSAPEVRNGALAVGRLAAEKGFDVLIEACALAGQAVEVIGDGLQRDALVRRAAGLGVEASFPGAMSPAEVHRRMASARVVVVPSRREGLGLVAVEAMLCGTPVIASHTGGLPEALGDPSAAMPATGRATVVPGGLLVRPDDVAGLAWALAQPLAAPGAAAVAAATRHRPDLVAARHVHLYREAVGSLGLP